MSATSKRIALAVLVALLLPATSGAAVTKTKLSTNWAGYVVTPKTSATKFKRISGTWKVPQSLCTPGNSGYSATWVGLGGYPHTAKALEQTGTESDCSAKGAAKYSAWFELVPRPSRTLKMAVHAGDTITAIVTVDGSHVEIYLRNQTRRKTFRRGFRISKVDTRSAEWIVEAPSHCVRGHCKQMPITNFGTVPFKRASVTTSKGKRGRISGSHWARTKLALSQGGARPVERVASPRGALPSGLSRRGAAFSVAYTALATAAPSRDRNIWREPFRPSAWPIRRSAALGYTETATGTQSAGW
jgi:hypothetical protein